ncbi:hypothetical protein [Actinoplanes sp. URMC 104]|uniref:hypothetical protein n=1 Tax=Actinoplanes sp. URMC 104 TaxID=3423409 RepID=UPI003F1A516B
MSNGEPYGVEFERPCANDRDHAGGDWCPGTLMFHPYANQAACPECGAWCGRFAPPDLTCPRDAEWAAARRSA